MRFTIILGGGECGERICMANYCVSVLPIGEGTVHFGSNYFKLFYAVELFLSLVFFNERFFTIRNTPCVLYYFLF